MARANAFWPTAVVGEADSVNSVSASACHIGGPKGVSPGQKALLHGIFFTPYFNKWLNLTSVHLKWTFSLESGEFHFSDKKRGSFLAHSAGWSEYGSYLSKNVT